MILLPAIDLYEGRVVRLYQGDYARMTVYPGSPADTARAMRDAGATHLHVIDLEGARRGTPCNLPALRAIHDAAGLAIEAGGGVRTQADVAALLDAGASRVIVGTAAVRDRAFLTRRAAEYPGKLAVSADLRAGEVMIRGWTEGSGSTFADMAALLRGLAIDTLIVTDIARDGALGGPNHALYAQLAGSGLSIIASGGVTTLDDVRRLRRLGLYGAIVGRAYYEGGFDLAAGVREAT